MDTLLAFLLGVVGTFACRSYLRNKKEKEAAQVKELVSDIRAAFAEFSAARKKPTEG
jgi:hypothetical protein